MYTLRVLLTFLVTTPVLGTIVIAAGLLGVRDRPGGVFEWAPRIWSRAVLWAAGIRLFLHGEERMRTGAPRIFVVNHVSWFDVFTLASILPRYKFIAKAELARIPLFGRAARSAGMIFIDRDNR